MFFLILSASLQVLARKSQKFVIIEETDAVVKHFEVAKCKENSGNFFFEENEGDGRNQNKKRIPIEKHEKFDI